MMKKILHSLFSLALIVSLAACVSSGGGNPWSGQQNAEAPASAEPNPLTREALTREILSPSQGLKVEGGSAAQAGYETAEAQTQAPYQPPEFETIIDSTTAPPALASAETNAPGVKVALLVPMSGKHADLGQAMMQSAQLALFDMGYDKIELMPQDTKGTPEGARVAAQQALNDGAQLILGPVFAGEARAVAPIAQQRNVNVITFSTDWTLAQNNVFVMGFLPFTQVERIVQYAAAQRLQRIGIIAPETEYGNIVVSAWNVQSSRYGLAPASILRVTPGSAAASEKISAFANADARAAAAQAGSPMPAPFDALFLPVGGSEAVSLADSLAMYDLDPQTVRRLGTGLWDDAALATQKSLDGAWFAASDPALRKAFERRYYDAYGAAPPRLSTLAYDAMSLAVVLAKSGLSVNGSPAYDRTSIGNPNGFAGIDGIFRFRPDGMAERGLAILEFRHGSLQVVDPAPRSFVRTSY
jgi:branched-chain amino acid transport system substrate-binding protein